MINCQYIIATQYNLITEYLSYFKEYFIIILNMLEITE